MRYCCGWSWSWNRSDELDNQLEAARLELETLQTAAHEGLSGAGSGTAKGLAQGAPSRGHGGSRKRALRASRKEEASPAFSQGPRGSSLRETSPFEVSRSMRKDDCTIRSAHAHDM